MADKRIGELPSATQVDDDSLLVMEQQSTAYSVSGLLVKNYAKQGVEVYAEGAKKSAQEANAKANEAAQSAGNAAQSAQDAQNSAASAKNSANLASQSEQNAADSAVLSQSWAVGGTGTRTGEDADNAKYWAEQAAHAAGGGVSSFNNRSGFVLPEIGDYSVDMIDGAVNKTLSNITDHASAIHNLGAAGNKNLVDNWYFGHPDAVVDQRQGYVAPPDTPYFSDIGLTAQAGTLTDYAAASPGDGVYGTVTVDGVVCYVDWTKAVRGYVKTGGGVSFAFDRWEITPNTYDGNPMTVLLQEGHVRLIGTYKMSLMRIKFESLSRFVGKTVTLSLLCRGSGTAKSMSLRWDNNKMATWIPKSETEFEVVQLTGKVPEDVTDSALLYAAIYPSYVGDAHGEWLDVKAAKLELGGVQTLARQDENGRWVLNDPPPDYGTELAKCQRYQIEMNPHGRHGAVVGIGVGIGTNVSYVFVPLPVQLRKVPTLIMKGSWGLLDIRSNSPKGHAVVNMSVNGNNTAAAGVWVGVTTEDVIEKGAPLFLAPYGDANGRLMFDANQ